MNRKQDELIRCAFGDLDPREAEQIRARCQGDAKVARELAEYEAMREGLAKLKDIPEMQLSRERLKHAILAEGLKPAKSASGPWWDRLAWPVALVGAAGLAFMVVSRINPATPLPGVPGGGLSDPNPVPQSDFLAMSGQPFGSRVDFSAPTAAADTVKAATTLAVVTEAKPQRTSNRRRVKRTVVPKESPELVAEAANSPAMASSESFDAQPMAAMTITYGRQQPKDEGIVVIDPSPTESGSQRAVEMEAASNVLVGG